MEEDDMVIRVGNRLVQRERDEPMRRERAVSPSKGQNNPYKYLISALK